MQSGTIGNIKVAYTMPGDKKVYSRMFDEMDAAVKFLKGKQNALLFNLKQLGNGTYAWEVLPYGDYRSYKIGLFIKNNLLELTLMGVAIYFAVKHYMQSKKLKAAAPPAASAKPAAAAASSTAASPEPASSSEPTE